MILVSTRFPEVIPSFKASRRAGVAAMFAGRLNEYICYGPYLCDPTDPSVSGWGFRMSPRDRDKVISMEDTGCFSQTVAVVWVQACTGGAESRQMERPNRLWLRRRGHDQRMQRTTQRGGTDRQQR